MGKRDRRVDAYIEKSQEFAKPILRHLREVVHGACPDVEETIKWGFPHFQYRGMFCSMASFKRHCAFVFYRGRHVLGETEGKTGAMGQFGRITAVADLPPKAGAAFDALSPSHKREYVEWITEAKRDETRARRLGKAVAWMAEGKTQNWRYER